MSDILVSQNGAVTQTSLGPLLEHEHYAIRGLLISILEEELRDPKNSELISLIREVMETIADDEIEKVLE